MARNHTQKLHFTHIHNHHASSYYCNITTTPHPPGVLNIHVEIHISCQCQLALKCMEQKGRVQWAMCLHGRILSHRTQMVIFVLCHYKGRNESAPLVNFNVTIASSFA